MSENENYHENESIEEPNLTFFDVEISASESLENGDSKYLSPPVIMRISRESISCKYIDIASIYESINHD